MKIPKDDLAMVYHFKDKNLAQLSNILKKAYFGKKSATPAKNGDSLIFEFFLKDGLNQGSYLMEAKAVENWNWEAGEVGFETLPGWPIEKVEVQESKVSLIGALWELSFFGKDVWFTVYKLKPNTNIT